MDPQIARSARKHGIADGDMLHVIRQAIQRIEEEEAVMYVGADQSGRILEVMVVTRHGGRSIVHAMPVRSKNLR